MGSATNVPLSNFQKLGKYDKNMPKFYQKLCGLYYISGILILFNKTRRLYIICKCLYVDYINNISLQRYVKLFSN